MRSSEQDILCSRYIHRTRTQSVGVGDGGHWPLPFFFFPVYSTRPPLPFPNSLLPAGWLFVNCNLAIGTPRASPSNPPTRRADEGEERGRWSGQLRNDAMARPLRTIPPIPSTTLVTAWIGWSHPRETAAAIKKNSVPKGRSEPKRYAERKNKSPFLLSFLQIELEWQCVCVYASMTQWDVRQSPLTKKCTFPLKPPLLKGRRRKKSL